MIYSRNELNQLAWAIDADGVERHEGATQVVADQARRAGVSSSLVEVLADASMPAPVRERAFGKVVHAMAHVRARAAVDAPEWALAN